MISAADRRAVLAEVTSFWAQHVTDPGFLARTVGKETGHQLADYVDERTTEILKHSFGAEFETDSKNKVKTRSMGDIWFPSCGIWNPVNVKAGLMGMNGQPNIVSLGKLFDSLTSGRVDSYDLLIVKFSNAGTDEISPHIYFVDILNYLDYVTYDMGPGQMMLKEALFYAKLDASPRAVEVSLEDKVKHLIDLYEDGYARLLKNREDSMQKRLERAEKFFITDSHEVEQKGLYIGGKEARKV